LFENRHGNREAALALQSALLELPEEQREVVVLRVWSGLTLEETASLTEVSLNTAASRYRYALNKLRERLKPYQKERLLER
jgi:RNA polymerase sigma-70 factor, ECF subfamily